MRSVWVLLLVGACNFRTNPQGVIGDGPPKHDAPIIDSSIDSPPDAFDPKCFGSGAFYLCLQSVPSGNMTLPSSIDTSQCTSSNGTEAMLGTTRVCVYAAGSMTIDTTGVGGGSNAGEPLVVVATGDIMLNTSLDASSSNNPDLGPGANFSGCSTTNGGTTNAGGGGGGAGGSFGTKGANGGTGASAGGTAEGAASMPVDLLRGGCPGGTGAPGGQSVAGGPGGGAVYLVARGNIIINGLVTASGGGGIGGLASKGGGGGGGSGGMIVLHAGHVQLNSGALLFANGGGGGGGAGNGTDGKSGDDATQFGAAAAGGTSNGGGSCAGGNGAFGTTAATAVNGGNGGGGGGGGAGVIRVLAGGPVDPTKFSPAPTN
jgi:hypothetical protein